ncbi:hypothetical protein GH733_007626 [Mirounga leonina]|nr:hypothetical protein GH733_007626 [Mirounga leonina]
MCPSCPRSTSSQPHPAQPLPRAVGTRLPQHLQPQAARHGGSEALRPAPTTGCGPPAGPGHGGYCASGPGGASSTRAPGQAQGQAGHFPGGVGACLPPGALEEQLGSALAAQVHGVSSLGNGSEARNWDLPSALLFTASILTTTGYGYMAPLSASGKAFCVLYAALRLPAPLALLAARRRRLLPLLSRPVAAGWGLLAAATLVQLPALVLRGLRGDCSLLETVYFCFNSLSTLGLGHLLPGGGRYLLLGLLATLLAVETFSELPQVRALVTFFGSSGPLTAEGQGGILGQDELALSTLPPSAAAPEQAPTC